MMCKVTENAYEIKGIIIINIVYFSSTGANVSHHSNLSTEVQQVI